MNDLTLSDRYRVYNDGHRAGRADRAVGYTSRYSSVAFSTEPEYVQLYFQGYRDGNLGLAARFSQI